MGDAEEPAQLALAALAGRVGSSYLGHRLSGQSRLVVGCAGLAWNAALRRGVLHVVPGRPEKQMSGVAAGRVIAVVASEDATGDRPVRENEGETMSSGWSP